MLSTNFLLFCYMNANDHIPSTYTYLGALVMLIE
jgi:hypothetical protein